MSQAWHLTLAHPTQKARSDGQQDHLNLPGTSFHLNYKLFFCFFPARSLDKLYNFADCSGLHLIFALNALRRNPNNSWNSSNALSLLKYSASKKYNISWELGNGECGNRRAPGMELAVAERYSLLEEDICRSQDALPM